MEYRIIEGLDNMELSDIVRLLRTTYWAGTGRWRSSRRP